LAANPQTISTIFSYIKYNLALLHYILQQVMAKIAEELSTYGQSHMDCLCKTNDASIFFRLDLWIWHFFGLLIFSVTSMSCRGLIFFARVASQDTMAWNYIVSGQLSSRQHLPPWLHL
jgi:hypothetical protein